VTASTTHLELAADGSATLRHELSVASRTGSFERLTIDGVDSDAVPLPDASVTCLDDRTGRAAEPVSAALHIDAGRLELTLPEHRALLGKNFLLQFGYQSQLLERGRLHRLPEPGRSELVWIGPAFEQGVDSLTLIVRIPAAERAPSVESAESPEAVGGVPGLLATTLRRSEQADELELVRPHVARNETPFWRVSFDSSALPALPIPKRSAVASSAPGTAGPRTAAPSTAAPRPSPLGKRDPSAAVPAQPQPVAPPAMAFGAALAAVLLGAVGYALLVAYKAWSFASACAERGCTARAWVSWAVPLRAAAAGVSFGGAMGLVLWAEAPFLASLTLLLALSLAALRTPEAETPLRGPGHWQTLDAAVLEPSSTPALPGAWLDVGRVPGCLLFLLALGGWTALARSVFANSPYLGACLLLAASVLLPVFCTGRERELPLDALAESRRFLRRARQRLARDRRLVVKPLGRFCAATRELDELRLSISPARGLPGLIAMELALEIQPGLGGQRAEPVIVIRSTEGSRCQLALPRQLCWTRGRSADERAALLRPKLPTSRLAVALVQESLAVMGLGADGSSATAAKKARKSSGNGLATANAATRSSPAHAT